MAVAAARVPTGSTTADWVAERVRAHAPVVSLRDYQDDAITSVANAVERDGHRRVVVVLPTGAGKTLVFGELARGWLADGLGRVLVLAHRDELLTQAIAKLSLMVPRHLIGLVKANHNNVDAPIIVASVQTLDRPHRLAQVGQFGLIVIDESHHAAAASYHRILTELGAFEPSGPVVVGVTATPKRADGLALDSVFQDIVYRKTYTDMMAAGYLVPVISKAFELIPAPTRVARGIDGDYADGALGKLMLGANAPDKIVEAWQEHGEGRKTLVFTPTVSVAKAAATAFQDANVPAGWVSGAQALTDRRQVLADFAAGRLQVVANCSALSEGFDEPSVSCVIIGRPTMNESLYIQMVGRGTRLHPESGKTNCLILDMVGCVDQLQLDAIIELGGRRARARDDAERELTPRTYEDVAFEAMAGRLVGRTVQAAKSACRWVTLGDGWYALSLIGEGWVVLKPTDDGTWSVLRWAKSARKPTQEHEGLSLDWAKAAGEGVARNAGAFGPMTQQAAWLDRPLSEKAFAFGQRMGFELTAETTAWQFTQMQAQKAFPRWRA